MRPAQTRLEHLLARFARERSGAVAIIFGMLVVPIIVLAGAGFDYAEASRVRQKAQDAADAAVLAAARERPGQPAELTGDRFFRSQMGNRLQGLELPAWRTSDGVTEVRFHFGAGVPTSFVGMIGWRTIPIEVRATAQRVQRTAATNPCVRRNGNERLFVRPAPRGGSPQAEICEVDPRAAAQGIQSRRHCRSVDVSTCAMNQWDVRLVE